MARDFMQLKVNAWQDDDWTALTLEQQAVYLMLSSQATTNLAGVLDYLPGRFSRLSAGTTPAHIRRIINDLEHAGMVFVDEDTEELLIRAYVRVSEAWKMPNCAKSIATIAAQTMSRKLQAVLLYELQRVLAETAAEGKWESSRKALAGAVHSLESAGIEPWNKGNNNPSVNPSPKGYVKGYVNPSAGGDIDGDTEGTPNPSPNPSAKGSPNPRGVNVDVDVDVNGDVYDRAREKNTPAEPALISAQAAAGGGVKEEQPDSKDGDPAPASKRRRPARPLPDDWEPTDKHHDYAAQRGIDIDQAAEAFRAHAEANDRRQVNWDASFRLWLANSRPTTTRPGTTRAHNKETSNLAVLADFVTTAEQQQMRGLS